MASLGRRHQEARREQPELLELRRRDEAPRRLLAPDTMFAPSAAEDARRSALSSRWTSSSIRTGAFPADFQSPSERSRRPTSSPPEAEEAPTNFSTTDEQHAAGFKLVGTIDDVASDGDPRDDAEVAAMKAAAAARVGAGGPPARPRSVQRGAAHARGAGAGAVGESGGGRGGGA